MRKLHVLFISIIASLGLTTLANACEVKKPSPQLEVISYYGDCLNGLAHGQGQLTLRLITDRSGQTFRHTGEFHQGTANGWASIVSNSGNSTFNGEVRNWSRWKGTGALKLPDGSTTYKDYKDGQVVKEWTDSPSGAATAQTSPNPPASPQQNKAAEALIKGLFQGINRQIAKDREPSPPAQTTQNFPPLVFNDQARAAEQEATRQKQIADQEAVRQRQIADQEALRQKQIADQNANYQRQQAEQQAQWAAAQKEQERQYAEARRRNELEQQRQAEVARQQEAVRIKQQEEQNAAYRRQQEEQNAAYRRQQAEQAAEFERQRQQAAQQEAIRQRQQQEQLARWEADQKAALAKWDAEQKAALQKQDAEQKALDAQQKGWQQPATQGWSNPPRTQQPVAVNTPNAQASNTPQQKTNSTYNQAITLPPPNSSFGNANSTPATVQSASNQNTDLVIAAALVGGAIFFAPEELIGGSVIAAYTQRRYVVYVVKEYGKVVYVGISSNFAVRKAWHFSQNRIAVLIDGLSNLSEIQAHGVEQALIERFGLGKNGGQLLNKINSINIKNPRYHELLSEGKNLLRKVGWQGF
jgi:hypothetical protein